MERSLCARLHEAHRLLHGFSLAGCESGKRAGEWRSALAPAEVVAYPRLTATAEHLLWLWTEGPELVGRLE